LLKYRQTMSSKPSGPVAAVAGGIAGASETIITYPAEFIKTRRQLPVRSDGPRTSWAILRTAFRSQGLVGIYSGSPALITSNTAKGGIRFFSFQSSKKFLEQRLGTNNSLVNVLAGLCAGATEAILVVTPAEVIKTQAIDMSAASRRRSTVAVARHVINTKGILGLWRGLGPVLSKQGTNSAVRFASFGAIKDMLDQPAIGTDKLSSASSNLLAGALSGVVTT
jgi:solute carrier family 25 (mitochondrial citrate transporter), member 1